MQAQFESIFKELGAAAAASGVDPESGGATEASARAAGGGNTEASFQETIRQTMERMQVGGDQATTAAAAEG